MPRRSSRAAGVRGDLSGQRAEGADGCVRAVLGEDLLDHLVDTVGRGLVLAVPREGAGQAPRRHRAGLIVVKNELELREFLIK